MGERTVEIQAFGQAFPRYPNSDHQKLQVIVSSLVLETFGTWSNIRASQPSLRCQLEFPREKINSPMAFLHNCELLLEGDIRVLYLRNSFCIKITPARS